MPDDDRQTIWRLGKVEFDAGSGRLTLSGAYVDIDRSALAILRALLEKDGEPLSKDHLLEAGWPGRIVHENSLAKAIGRLRQALGEEGGRIEAVYGSGYRLTGPVRRVPAPLRSGGAMAGRRTSAVLGRRASIGGALGALLLLVSAAVAVYAMISLRAARQEVAESERQAEILLGFLGSEFLSSSDPYSPAFQDRTLREAVLRAAATMDARLRDDPATRVTLHRMIATAFSNWGEYEKAVTHLDRAAALNVGLHGERSTANVPVDIELCQNLRLAGEPRRAEGVCARAEDVASGSGSSRLHAARIARAKLQFEIGQYDAAATALAGVLQQDGQLTSAERADAEWFYGLSLRKLARFDLAEQALRRHLVMRQTLHGEEHPLTAWAYSDFGDFLVDAGDFTRAEVQLDRAQRIFDATLGPDHPESLSPVYSRAIVHLWRGRPGEARALLRPLLARYRELLGADHFWTLYTMSELALADAQSGDRDSAAALLREARKTGARVLYGRDGKAAHFHMRWARTLAAMGKVTEAEDERRLAREAMDRARFMPDHPWRARLHCLKAQIARAQDDGGEARGAARACLSGLDAADALPETYPARAEARALMGVRAIAMR